MYWDQMTMDEFAMFQQSEGLKVVQLDGIWWVEIRPFFFRPLFPFAAIDPQSKRYPLKTLVGGYLHAVPDGVSANSTMNVFVYDDLKSYSLSSLNSKRRKATTTGIKYFTARSLSDVDEFIDSGYDVYISFQKRTNYSYKDERVNRQAFTEWAKNLYRNPKVHKLGAYHNNRLSAIEISYLVEHIIIGDTLFADDTGLKLNVTDFLYHTLREAAAHSDAQYFYLGLPTGVKSLDQSKLSRGCKLLRMPACYEINPVTLSLVKVFMKSSYQKLMEIIAPPSQEEPVDMASIPLRTEDESSRDYLQGPR